MRHIKKYCVLLFFSFISTGYSENPSDFQEEIDRLTQEIKKENRELMRETLRRRKKIGELRRQKRKLIRSHRMHQKEKR